MSEPASPELGFPFWYFSLFGMCFCCCPDKTSRERKGNPVVGMWVLANPCFWGFEKFTAACLRPIFPGQLQVCIGVSSWDAWSSGMPSLGANWLKSSACYCTPVEKAGWGRTLSLGSLRYLCSGLGLASQPRAGTISVRSPVPVCTLALVAAEPTAWSYLDLDHLVPWR